MIEETPIDLYDGVLGSNLLSSILIGPSANEPEELPFEQLRVILHKGERISFVLISGFLPDARDVLYITDSQKEASRIFREQILAGWTNGGYDYDLLLKPEVWDPLVKNGLLDDFRTLSSLVDVVGEPFEEGKLAEIAESKGLNLGKGYNWIIPVTQDEDEKVGNHIMNLLYLLEIMGYTEVLDDETYRMKKQVDF